MKSVLKFQGGKAVVKSWADDIEATAQEQLRNMASLPFIHPNGLAVMADCHAGKGSTIGTVIPTIKALIPAAVGVDIGCGMHAVRTSLTPEHLPDSLAAVRSAIEKAVPVGFAQHKTPNLGVSFLAARQPLACLTPGVLNTITENMSRVVHQVATLGGGNHFIEICTGSDGFVWVMLHSGSRGIGNRLATKYIDMAKEEMERWHLELPDKDLAFLPEGLPVFDEYVEAVHWAQDYAKANRDLMMNLVINAMREVIGPFDLSPDTAVNCHHNYVEKESHYGRNVWVTRKGAIRAREGDMGIIPGSMGQRSYIVRGKGNEESYCSCSHGAGRVMSRTQARKAFSLTDLVRETEGVECRKDTGVLDEIPSAYRNIDKVMEAQQDLVEVVCELKQVLCVKG